MIEREDIEYLRNLAYESRDEAMSNRLHEIVDEIERIQNVAVWKLIETAPHGKKFTLESEEDYAEYCEEKDAYYAAEGWYECIDNWDDFSSVFVASAPTHWHPLPEPPETQ